MTTQAQQPAGGAPQVLDPDTAYAVVHQRVYGPVFFEKLAADYNIRPRSEQEAMEMLTMAAQLRQAHDLHEKQASANTGLAGARAHLNQQLAQMGIQSQPEQNQLQHQVKQAAAQASFDPDLSHAILSLQAAAAGVVDENYQVRRQQPQQ